MNTEKKFLIKVQINCFLYLNNKITINELMSITEGELSNYENEVSEEIQKKIINFLNEIEKIYFLYDIERKKLYEIEIKKLLNYLDSKLCKLEENSLENEIKQKIFFALYKTLSREKIAQWIEMQLVKKNISSKYLELLTKIAVIDLKNENGKYKYSNDNLIDWIIEIDKQFCKK